MTENNVEIKSEYGHYVGYINGESYCEGDTYSEVRDDLYEFIKNNGESQ